jgi:opacity protein-like surface antigen
MKLRSLLAVALLAPAVALAAAPPPAPKSKPTSSKPAPAPAAESQSSSASSGLEVGGFIGYETDNVSGLALRFDAELPFQALSPQVKMSWVGSVGFSYLTESVPFGDFTAYVFKIVPAARFTLPLNPQFSVFGDAGLGLAYVSAKTEVTIPGFTTVKADDSSLNIMMRLGVGAWYQVNPRMKVGGMLEFDPIFGDFGFSGASSQNTFNILAGLMYKL